MNTRVTVSNQPQVIKVTSGLLRLRNLSDMNFNNATDGAILQYDAASNTWIAENVLRSGLSVNCGNF